jgi:hypothetical protein
LFKAPRAALPSCLFWLLASALVVLTVNLPATAASLVVDQLDKKWIGTWASSPQPFMPGALEIYRNQSLRLIVHTSVGGSQIRIRISNTFGDLPLFIGGAHIARRASGAEIDSASDRLVTFDGHSSITVPARSMLVSDPVDLDIPALSDVAISIFLPKTTRATTSHFLALQTSYVSPAIGDSSIDGDGSKLDANQRPKPLLLCSTASLPAWIAGAVPMTMQ